MPKQVHCPHVVPTGGGKYVDYAYPLEYVSDQEPFTVIRSARHSCAISCGSWCLHNPSLVLPHPLILVSLYTEHFGNGLQAHMLLTT
jgi:hypothetical protein